VHCSQVMCPSQVVPHGADAFRIPLVLDGVLPAETNVGKYGLSRLAKARKWLRSGAVNADRCCRERPAARAPY
jgi:hypothetical protein